MTADYGQAHSGKNAGLNKVLSRFDVISLAVGAMIGWGWVVLAGTWVASAGTGGGTVAFVIGGVIVGLIGLTYAELVAALPFAGGEHVFVDRAFGSVPAFVATWAILLGYISVVAFEAIALPVALVYLFPDIKQILLWEVAGYQVHLTEIAIGSGTAILVALLNIYGIKAAARAQGLVVLSIFLAGLLLIIGGVRYEGPSAAEAFTNWGGVAAVIIMVPFLFVGFDVIPQSAEEIDLPPRKIGIMLLVSVFIAVLFYVGIVFGVGAAPLAGSEQLAAADAARLLWNSDILGIIIVLAGVAGILTSWNAFLLGGSRALFALARAGQVPRILAATHPRFGTPHYAIVFIALLSVFAPMLGRQALVWLVNAGGMAIILAYAFVAASFLKLRHSEPDMERPYKAPAGVLIGSLALLLSLSLFALYLPMSPSGLVWPQEWLIVMGWSLIGAVIFFAGRSTRRRDHGGGSR